MFWALSPECGASPPYGRATDTGYQAPFRDRRALLKRRTAP